MKSTGQIAYEAYRSQPIPEWCDLSPASQDAWNAAGAALLAAPDDPGLRAERDRLFGLLSEASGYVATHSPSEAGADLYERIKSELGN